MIKLVILISLLMFACAEAGGGRTAGAHASAQADETELFPIYVRGKVGYIDRTGRIAIEPRFDLGHGEFRGSFAERNFFSVGLAAVAECRDSNRRCKFGFIDGSGKFVVEPQFDAEGYFRNGLASQTIRPYLPAAPGQWGYIDRTGRFVWKSAD
jgi:hypothetical protein